MDELLINAIKDCVVVVLTAYCTYKVGKANKKTEKEDNIGDGVKELLREKIMEAHDKYIEKGSIPSYRLESITEMYETYHKLGGNGFITKEFEEIKGLPIEIK